MAIYEVIQEFASSRDPLTKYTVHRRIDHGPKRGQFSCTCPGWTRRVAPDGSRSCKHTKQVVQQLGLEQTNRAASIAVNRAKDRAATAPVKPSQVTQALDRATAPKPAPARASVAAMEPSPFDGVLRRRITLDD